MTPTETASRVRRLALPGTALALGALAWLAQAAGGDPRGGAISFAIMAVYGAAVYFLAARFDVARVLAGEAPDERYRAIDQRALGVVGMVLIVYVIAGFLWEQAHGRSGMPFTLMGAVAAAAYVGALFYGRFRG